jgi:hypothetical protein
MCKVEVSSRSNLKCYRFHGPCQVWHGVFCPMLTVLTMNVQRLVSQNRYTSFGVGRFFKTSILNQRIK